MHSVVAVRVAGIHAVVFVVFVVHHHDAEIRMHHLVQQAAPHLVPAAAVTLQRIQEMFRRVHIYLRLVRLAPSPRGRFPRQLESGGKGLVLALGHEVVGRAAAELGAGVAVVVLGFGELEARDEVLDGVPAQGAVATQGAGEESEVEVVEGFVDDVGRPGGEGREPGEAGVRFGDFGGLGRREVGGVAGEGLEVLCRGFEVREEGLRVVLLAAVVLDHVVACGAVPDAVEVRAAVGIRGAAVGRGSEKGGVESGEVSGGDRGEVGRGALGVPGGVVAAGWVVVVLHLGGGGRGGGGREDRRRGMAHRGGKGCLSVWYPNAGR